MFRQEAPSKEFEKHVEQALKRKFPKEKGWVINPQFLIRYKGAPRRVDFAVKHSRTGEAILVDAKSGKSLTIDDIQQLRAYMTSARVKKGMLYIANDTDRVKNIDEAAKKSNIEICKTRWKKPSVW